MVKLEITNLFEVRNKQHYESGLVVAAETIDAVKVAYPELEYTIETSNQSCTGNSIAATFWVIKHSDVWLENDGLVKWIREDYFE